VKTVLIVDPDLGFAFWLGHTLDQVGFDALPARSVPDAVQLLEELNAAVDLLLLNTALPDAASFVADLRLRQRPFKVIAIHDRPETSEPFVQADATRFKTEAVDEVARQDWIQTVKAMLR
jgi:DNA-binding response OmpR family regulator